jgi:hypothetical protein
MFNSLSLLLRRAARKQAGSLTHVRVTAPFGADIHIAAARLFGSKSKVLAVMIALISVCCADSLFAALTLRIGTPSCSSSSVSVQGLDQVPASIYSSERPVTVGMNVYNEDQDVNDGYTPYISGLPIPNKGWFGSWGPQSVTIYAGVNIITVGDSYGQSAAGTVTVQPEGLIWTYNGVGLGSVSYSLGMNIIVACLVANTPSYTMVYNTYESPGSDSYTWCVNGKGIPMTDYPGDPMTTDGSGTLSTIADNLWAPPPTYASPCNNSCPKTWHVLDARGDIDVSSSDDTPLFEFSTTSPVLVISDSQISPGISF